MSHPPIPAEPPAKTQNTDLQSIFSSKKTGQGSNMPAPGGTPAPPTNMPTFASTLQSKGGTSIPNLTPPRGQDLPQPSPQTAAPAPVVSAPIPVTSAPAPQQTPAAPPQATVLHAQAPVRTNQETYHRIAENHRTSSAILHASHDRSMSLQRGAGLAPVH